MSDDFIDKEEQNEENIPTPENGHLDYKPADTKNTGVKHQPPHHRSPQAQHKNIPGLCNEPYGQSPPLVQGSHLIY